MEYIRYDLITKANQRLLLHVHFESFYEMDK